MRPPMTAERFDVTSSNPAPLPRCMESFIENEAIETVKRELAELGTCLLPPAPCLPDIPTLDRLRAASALHEKLHVVRRHVTFLEFEAPNDPIVHELRAEVELLTSRLIELGVISREAFVRKDVAQCGGSFGGSARLSA